MNESDRGQARKRKLIAAGAFNAKLNFFFYVNKHLQGWSDFLCVCIWKEKKNSGKDALIFL